MTVAVPDVNERAAKAAGLDYDKMYTYNQSHASYYPGAHGISMKVLYEKKTGRLLGAQAVGGPTVAGRVDVFATAITAGMTVAQINELDLVYAPPVAPVYDPILIAASQAMKLVNP